MLVIGSKALAHNGLETGRKIRDIDLIASPQEVDLILANYGSKVIDCSDTKKGKLLLIQGFSPIEIEFAIGDNLGARLQDYANGLYLDTSEVLGLRGLVASPEICLTLKLSHRYLKNSPHFLKTMSDITLLRSLGYSVPKELKSWLKDRETATYDYSHPNLKQGKTDFFTDNVKYVYCHDDIHRIIAIEKTPAYTKFQVDGEDVQSSKKKFFKLDERTRLLAVLEESLVLSVERSQIPHPETHPDRSFAIAIKKLSTSISSGWFREFAWENYNIVMRMYNEIGIGYMEKINNAIKNNELKSFQ
jgi:hypothetical protein